MLLSPIFLLLKDLFFGQALYFAQLSEKSLPKNVEGLPEKIKIPKEKLKRVDNVSLPIQPISPKGFWRKKG